MDNYRGSEQVLRALSCEAVERDSHRPELPVPAVLQHQIERARRADQGAPAGRENLEDKWRWEPSLSD